MAKRCHASGGFVSDCTDPIMIGQIQVCRLRGDPDKARAAVLGAKAALIASANAVDPILVKFGGGCRDVEARVLETDVGPMLIVHLLVDCRDAMGANAVNTMCEAVGPEVGDLAGGVVVLKIISNLAIERLARVRATFTPAELATAGDAIEGAAIVDGVLDAFAFAKADPFRATTNNKGIMNAVSPIAVATGQDWRAVEAGCHAYAQHRYGGIAPLVRWSKDAHGNLVGAIEIPAPVGLVGGAARVRPRAGKGCEIIPSLRGSLDFGRFPLVSADFWTSDRLSERSRRVDPFTGTRARARNTHVEATLNHPLPAQVHPAARANVALLGVKTATDLGKVLAAAGIAQNLGALRALATVGIQAGHMKLHAKNLAVQAGAAAGEIDAVVARAAGAGERMTATSIAAALAAHRSAPGHAGAP